MMTGLHCTRMNLAGTRLPMCCIWSHLQAWDIPTLIMRNMQLTMIRWAQFVVFAQNSWCVDHTGQHKKVKCFSQVAQDNYKALHSFFYKFPNFTQNEFFIFGESYGGIYAPTLSLLVATGKAKINFKVRRFIGLTSWIQSHDGSEVVPLNRAHFMMWFKMVMCSFCFFCFFGAFACLGLCSGEWPQQLQFQWPVFDLLWLLPWPLWRRVSFCPGYLLDFKKLLLKYPTDWCRDVSCAVCGATWT